VGWKGRIIEGGLPGDRREVRVWVGGERRGQRIANGLENTGETGPGPAEGRGLEVERRMVLLDHSGAPGGDHFDWMIQNGAEPGSALRTWRVMVRVDELVARDWFIGEPLAEHRAEYLTYSGPVGGDRGRVERVRAGRAWIRTGPEDLDMLDTIDMETLWDGGVRQRVRGWRIDDHAWRFVVNRA
jgi:hypothetical protein